MFLCQARRVVAMAMSHDLHVIPHGSSVYSYHLQYAFTNCPLAEYINLSPQVGEREGEREGEGERGVMGGRRRESCSSVLY